MAKIIHIALLVDDSATDADTLYNRLNNKLKDIPMLKDYAFNGLWKDYQMNSDYEAGDFIYSLQDIL